MSITLLDVLSTFIEFWKSLRNEKFTFGPSIEICIIRSHRNPRPVTPDTNASSKSTALDFLIPAVFTDKLSVPEGLSPSDPSQRGWLSPMDGLPAWVPFAAVVPAMLCYILVFMESHISELIVDKPERGLKKGSGLHLDIVLLSFLNVGCGFFGMPWHCAATVRSVTHVSSVTIMSRLVETKLYYTNRISYICPLFSELMLPVTSPILPMLRNNVFLALWLQCWLDCPF